MGLSDGGDVGFAEGSLVGLDVGLFDGSDVVGSAVGLPVGSSVEQSSTTTLTVPSAHPPSLTSILPVASSMTHARYVHSSLPWKSALG